MENNLTDYRKSYDKYVLEETKLPINPLELFEKWFDEVDKASGTEETNAMTVSCIGLDGFPKSRVVLLKKFSEAGFIFYTNYNSEKGKAIIKNPNVCISFFWPNLERQVIIKGVASKENEVESTAYFHSRPKGSQLGAWASDQSEIITGRKVLEKNLKSLEETYKDKAIPKPPHWGGFIIKPISIEFWQGRPNRLHDRILYTNVSDNWQTDRLSP